MNSPIAPQNQVSSRRRFKASEISEHLDVNMIAQVCLGISLSGYCGLLANVFSMQSKSFPKLLEALDMGNTEVINEYAHAFNGETMSLGLLSLAELAMTCERKGIEFTAAECGSAAVHLRETWETVHALCLRMGYIVK